MPNFCFTLNFRRYPSWILFIVAGAALWFRYHENDDRLIPGRSYDVALWVSSISIAGVGLLGVWKLFFAKV